METPAAEQPEQSTAAPEQAESAPAPAESSETTQQPVNETTEQPKQEQEPEWFSKRFGEITAKWRSEERQHQATAQELAQARAELTKLRTPAAEKPKTLSDFNYDE